MKTIWTLQICILHGIYYSLLVMGETSFWHTVGAEADDHKIEFLLSEVKGKDVTELIASGREKLASVPCGGGAAVAVAASGGGGAAAAPAAAETKKEEKVEEKEESDDVSIFYSSFASSYALNEMMNHFVLWRAQSIEENVKQCCMFHNK